MLCGRCISCLALIHTTPLSSKDHSFCIMGEESGGQRRCGFYQSVQVLRLSHLCQTLSYTIISALAVHNNLLGSVQTRTTVPIVPQDPDSLGLEQDSDTCIFKKRCSLFCLRSFYGVSRLRTTALHTSFLNLHVSFLWPLSLYVSILLTTISINISNVKLRASQILGYLKTLSWRQAWKIKYTNFAVASKRSQCLSSSKKIIVFVFLASKTSPFHKPRLLLIKGNSRSLTEWDWSS